MAAMSARLAICCWVLAAAALPAPPRYRVSIETTKGAIVIEVDRAWAPRGADRFHQLVVAGYYDDSRFFRVVRGKWAQFGISGDSEVAKKWRHATIKDEERAAPESNKRGTVAFAFAEPGGRSTQVFISLRDNSPLDAQGFIPFGRVVEGMEVADALNADFGEESGGGLRAGKQQPLFDGGNRYLDQRFPTLDKLIRARVMDR